MKIGTKSSSRLQSNDNDNNNYHSRRFGHKIGNELNEETAYDCLKPPGSYARRNACCRPLDGRSAQLMECTNTHRKIEQQLARKVAMMQDENASASVPFETFGSIFDCVSDTIRQRRNFGRRTTTTSMPSPAMPTEMPQTTTSAPAQSIEELDTSFENLRAGTIDVLTCAIGENGTDFRQTAKRAFDTCHRRLLASELREREQYARFGGTCSSPTIHMMICLSEQMYVECPNEYWAQEADGKTDRMLFSFPSI